MPPRVFLSYNRDNTDIADIIDNDWKSVGITLVRDIRDLKFKQNISDFMQQVGSSDYVLLLISDNYLKSKNCMHEALEMFRDADFKKKILPILTTDAKIHEPIDRLDYLSYWEGKIQELSNKIRSLSALTDI